MYRTWSTQQTAAEAVRTGTASQFDGVTPVDLADMAVTQTAMAYGYATHELAGTFTGTDSGTVEVRHRATRRRLGSCRYAYVGPSESVEAEAVVAWVDGYRDVIVVGTANVDTAECALARDLPEHAGIAVTFGGYGTPGGPSPRDGLCRWHTVSPRDDRAVPYWVVRTPVPPMVVATDDGDVAVIGTANRNTAMCVVLAECFDGDDVLPELEWGGWMFVDPSAAFEVRPTCATDDPTQVVPVWHAYV